MKFLYLLLLFPTMLFAQVPVDINSGNPAFPFPQFLAYESDNHSLGNLATTNAPGVTHAEMEQTIRDAWQIMANRFEYTGTTISGVQAIRANLGCPYDCSEGDGYALLAAAEMGDKTTFDGVWFRVHDFRMIAQPRYSDCEVPDPNYRYGRFALKDNGDSAADGDFDIALALLIASKQWGEDSGYTDACGEVINYKKEALNVIRGLVEKSEGDNIGDEFYATGDIGVDGYIKGGNTWNELTPWVPTTGVKAQFTGPTDQHIDYAAPAYFYAFADFLEKEGDTSDADWNIPQFKRGEASSDWLMGKMLDDAATLPLAGWVEVPSSNNPIYKNFLDGEDFRNPWRTILNYVWHGNPDSTWNPVTHQVESGGNSFEKEIGERLAKFLANTGDAPWGNECSAVGGGPGLTYSGPSQLKQYYNPNTGAEQSTFPLNWLSGTGSPAAVASQDFDLMGKLYRQCVIEWDTTVAGDGYLTSVPGYFHGFFRLLGMLTLSGNHHSPAEIELQSNVKVYHGLDKTFAFTGDELEYTISYRNYASVNAENVEISTVLPEGLSFVSSEGASHSAGNVTWNLGTVPGFKTSTRVEGASGEITMKVVVDPSFSGRICNSFELTTSNGKGWISNEFPNEETPVMQRNCVDIVEKALEITKEVNHEEVNPGDVVTYQVDFENASSGGFINGGRPDVIIGYAHGGHAAEAANQEVKIRLYHGAVEPYIDYGNYRISLFLNDNSTTCVSGNEGCDGVAWQLDNFIYEGGDPGAVSITSEKIVPGSDERGSWNQRIIVRFSEQLATITPHISRYFGLEGGRVHQGGATPLRAVWSLFNTSRSSVNWGDDWSWNPEAADGDGGLFYPVTNDFTDINNPDLPVGVYHNEACETPTHTVDNILVEEWDGFTWRRAYGNSPVPGRETNDVIVKDVLPEGFTFVGFVDDKGVDVGNSITILDEPVTYDEATRTITWTKSILQVKEGGSFTYKAIADFSSGTCTRADEEQINTASIEAQNESPVIVESIVNVTCEPVILPPAESSMVKEVLPINAEVGDEVEYTLSYKNTDGSSFQSDFTEEWAVREGNAFTIDGTGVTNTTTNNVQVSTNNFSHGTNGIIEATVQFADNAQFGFALRYEGDLTSTGIGNGYYLVFKPNSGSGNVETTLYNGLTQIGDSNTSSLKISPSLITDIKIELIDEQINVWMGNTSSPIPSLTFDGIEQRSGFVGVINGTPSGGDSFGRHKLTSFYSAMDSAFNLQIVDPVPGELEFVSSGEGVLVNGVVTFPIQEGPVLADEEFSYTWIAKIVSCPADTDSKIENIAFTNIFGLEENSIAAQAILDCSGIDLCGETLDEPLLTEGNEIVLCLSDVSEINIEDYVEPTSVDYELIWFDGPSKFDNEIDTPIIDIREEGEYIYYVAQIEDVVCGEGKRVGITFVIGGGSDVSGTIDITDAEFCLNTDPSTIDLDDYVDATGEIIWYETETSTTPIDKPIISTSIVSEFTYYIAESTGSCGDSTKMPIVINIVEALMAPIITEDVILCTGETLTIDIETYVEATGDLFWYLDNEATSTPVTTPVIDVSIASENIYYVSQKTGDCESERASIEVVIGGGIAAPEVENVLRELCRFDDILYSLDQFVIFTGDLTWYVNEITEETIPTPLFTIIEPTNVTYYVSQKDGDCESERVPITVEVIDNSTVMELTKEIYTGDSVNYDIVSELVATPLDYVWSAEENLNVTGEVTTTSIGDIVIGDVLINNTEIVQEVIYTIEPVSCNSDLDTIKLTVTVKPLPEVNITVSDIIEGEDIEVFFEFSEPTISETTMVISFTSDQANTADFNLDDEIVVIPEGVTIYSFTRPTIDDALVENNEEFEVSINSIDPINLSNTSATATGTIFDNDGAPNIIIGTDTVVEGGILQIPISLSTPAVDTIELLIHFNDIGTTANLDYDASEQTIMINEGEITPISPLLIVTTDDSENEPDEDLQVLVNLVRGTVNDSSDNGIATIQDDDVVLEIPNVIIEDATAVEGNMLEIPISLSATAVDTVELLVSFDDLSATTTLDYDASPQTIVFNIGESTPATPLFISIIDDIEVEGFEEFEVKINLISGTVNDITDTGIVTIEDNNTVVVAIPDCTIITNPRDGEVGVSISPIINWESVIDADGYLISIGTSPNDTDIVSSEDLGSSTRYFVTSDLEEETTYYITVTPYNNTTGLAEGCVSQFFTTEQINELSITKYGLSPNGDGVNDFWSITDIEEYPNNEVLIYNRWGDLVYRTVNYDNNFNVFNGEANQLTNIGAGTLLNGTYFYEIRIDGGEDFANAKGFLVLKR